MPEGINILAAKCAKERDVIVILDMGGTDSPLSSELLELCDIISPNETEAATLFK